MSEYDESDYPSGLYPDTEVRGEGRARRPKRPAPTIEAPHVYTLGWGVELRDPAAWVSSGGETDAPYWWAKREVAERIAIRYAGLGRHAIVMHGTRRRDCTSGARNPWEPGYRASVDGPRCGQSIQWAEAPNLTSARAQKRAERELAKELAKAARADAKERRAQSRKSAARSQRSDVPFAEMAGSSGDVAAVEYLLSRGLDDDRSYEAVSYLREQGADVRADEGELHEDALREHVCQLAADLAYSDLPTARRLVRRMVRGKGRTECRTAEQVIERITQERRELAARSRARNRAPVGAPKRTPTPIPETLPLRPSGKVLRKLGNEVMARERAAEREAAKVARAAEREAAKVARAAEREAAKVARAAERARLASERAAAKRAASPAAREELARRAESESRAVIARQASAAVKAEQERAKGSPRRRRARTLAEVL